MKVGISILTLTLSLGAVAYGQAPPEGGVSANANATPATSASPSSLFSYPTLDGALHYAVSASQLVQYGYFGPGNASYSAVLSGDASYTSLRPNTPFNMLFAGGVYIPESGGQSTSPFVDLEVSQGLVAKQWVFGISDSVSYLPESPTTGLSGVPGVGDIGTYPIIGPASGPAGGVLTESGNRVSNSVEGSVERLLTGKTSVSGSGSYSILRFLNGDDGFDNSQVAGQVAVNHRLDARDTISANAVYSVFEFGPGAGSISLTSRGINGVFSRELSRFFSVNVSAGPQWISSSDGNLIPSTEGVAVRAGLSYQYKHANAGIGYARGVNGGSGVQLGALANTVSGFFSEELTRQWLVSGNAAYTHTSTLATGSGTPPPGLLIPLGGNFSTGYGGLQLTRSLGRTLSAYVSYTIQDQNYDAAYTGRTAFSGTSQTFGIGISYRPLATRLGDF